VVGDAAATRLGLGAKVSDGVGVGETDADVGGDAVTVGVAVPPPAATPGEQGATALAVMSPLASTAIEKH